MAWFPVGPAFVFAPRNESYRRLSRRNEKGRQSIVRDIAVDPAYVAGPNTKPTIYIVEGRARDLTNAWRSDDDGATWTSIADTLRRQLSNLYIDPSCVAVNPANPDTIYLGTSSWYLYRSSDRGATWSANTGFSSEMRKILVDGRTAATPVTTVLYVATANGLRRSATGGATWDAAPILAGDIRALAGHFDAAAGTARVYAVVAGAAGASLFYTTNPAGAGNWTNLSSAGIGLPPANPATFDTIVVDVCRRNPNRAYVWLLRGDTTVGIYTTSAPATSWTQVAATNPPNGWQGIATFGVAPNSPGDGLTDVLVFGGVVIDRSTDAGRTWVTDAVWLHVDHRSLAFAPVDPPPGAIPVTYVGCDGGLAKSTQFANPSADIDIAQTYNESIGTPQDTHVWQNCNRGRQSIECLAYAVVREQPALSYLASWDSGVKAADTSRTWRGITDGDTNAVAAAAGPDGVAVWAALGLGGQLTRWRDTGEFYPAVDTPTLNGQPFSPWPLVAGHEQQCYLGLGASVGRVGPLGSAATGIATLVSAPFPGGARVFAIAVHPTDPNIVYCLTRDPAGATRVWMNTQARLSDLGTVWTEIATGRPQTSAWALAISGAGVAYVGMQSVPPSPVALYALSGGAWVPQQAIGAPPAGGPTRLVADPIDSNILYVVWSEATVYRLTLSAGVWSWQPFPSDGLPELIKGLCAIAVGPATAQQTVLRAATPMRGIFESRADPTVADPPIALYVRDNFLDTGWAVPSPSGVTNPLKPATKVWHWECADIKVDPQQRTSPSGRPYRGIFQTEPEWDGVSPLDAVLFDELRELPLVANRPAWVHVQVHNRARAKASGVSVWTVYCDASIAVPPLDATASGASFPFWSQFTAAGTIVPALPADSPWKAIGPPRVLPDLGVEHPQIASWLWTVPQAAHHCLVTFIHSAAAGGAVGETTRYDVNAITPTNRQVGQKNLVVLPPVPLKKKLFLKRPKRPKHGPKHLHITHSGASHRSVHLEMDLGDLPPAIELSFQTTVGPREIVGAVRAGRLREFITHLANGIGALLTPRAERQRFHRALYVATGGGRVEVHGIDPLPSGETIGLSLQATAALEPGREYRFSLIQREDQEVRGGITYVVRSEGDRPAFDGDLDREARNTSEAVVRPPESA